MNITATAFTSDSRPSCYTCPPAGSGTVKVKGKQMYLECRKFTEIGNQMEQRVTAMMTDLYRTGLIHIMPIGTDTAKMTWGKEFRFKTQSRGNGGLSKYQCDDDYQVPELFRHEKIGWTELLYVHYKGCPKEYIGTELQDMIFENDEYADHKDVDNAFSDSLIMAARKTISTDIQYTDIIGIFKGANKMANHYDGLLAQMYWAYCGTAYYHSLKFTIDEASLIDGMTLHAKYAGCEINLTFDSTVDTDAELGTFATYDELYSRLVDWLNTEVTTTSDRKYVDATYYSNNIIVTSKWAEQEVTLDMFVSEDETVESWAMCETYGGVRMATLQGCMPIDERPVLVEYKKYTKETILNELVCDIHEAESQMDFTLMREGQRKALFIDHYLYSMYKNAQKTKARDASPYALDSEYEVFELDALSVHGGTGIWFISVVAAQESRRNVKHVVDTDRSSANDIFVGFLDQSCDNIKLKYEQLHGLMVQDFRLLAGNLLCSPFVKNLKEPHEPVKNTIPCYNKRVRDCYLDPRRFTEGCQINAAFQIGDEYKNAALYMLDGEIKVLQAGETMPPTAQAVYEIQLNDRTQGIPVTELANVEYTYDVIFSDGIKYTLDGQNPIIQYSQGTQGVFNVIQTVTIPNVCMSTYNAAENFGGDYPFECRGACSDIEMKFEGRIDKEVLSATSALEFPTKADVVVVTSHGDVTIPTGSSIDDALTLLNDFLEANGQPKTIVFFKNDDGVLTFMTDGKDARLTVTTIDGVEMTEVCTYELTMVDSTEYDTGDGVEDAKIYVYPVGGTKPTDPTFTELPTNAEIDDESATGWTVEIEITTTYGCTFDGLTVDVLPVDGEENYTFNL